MFTTQVPNSINECTDNKPATSSKGNLSELKVMTAYCHDNDSIYVLEFIDGLNEGRLRCSEIQNNQQEKYEGQRIMNLMRMYNA